jgi:PsbP-like protein
VKFLACYCPLISEDILTDFLSKYEKIFTCRYYINDLALLLVLISSLFFFDIEWVNATPKDANSKSQFLTYNDPGYDIEIQYPYNWTIDKRQNSPYIDITKIVGFTKDPNALSGDFLISIHNLTNKYMNGTIGLAELLNRTVEYYKGYYQDFNLIEIDQNDRLNSPPNSAYRLVWIDKEGEYTIKTMQMGTIIGNQAYLIRYYAELGEYSDNLQLIERMIDSLKINNKSIPFNGEPNT